MANIDTFLGSALTKLSSMKTRAEKNEETNQEVIDYLYTLTEQLRYVLGHLEDDNFTDGALQKIISDSSGDNYASLEMDLNGIRARVANAEGDISDLEITASGLTTRVTNAEGNISTLTQTASGLTVTVSGLKSAQDASQLTFNSSGLTINNGGFTINKSGSSVFYVDSSGNLTMIGQLIFKNGSTEEGGLYYSSSLGLVCCADGIIVNDTKVTSGTSYKALLASDSYGGALRIKEASKTYDMVRAGVLSGSLGYVSVRNTSAMVAKIGAMSGGGGELELYNGSAYNHIRLYPGDNATKYCSYTTHDFVNYNNSGFATVWAAGYQTGSDRKLKENIEDISIEQAKELILALKPSTYKLKSEDSGTHWGFIAQDVKSVLDDIGEEFSGYREKALENDTYASLSYSEFIAPLVKIVQDQETRIKALEEQS